MSVHETAVEKMLALLPKPALVALVLSLLSLVAAGLAYDRAQVGKKLNAAAMTAETAKADLQLQIGRDDERWKNSQLTSQAIIQELQSIKADQKELLRAVGRLEGRPR